MKGDSTEKAEVTEGGNSQRLDEVDGILAAPLLRMY